MKKIWEIWKEIAEKIGNFQATVIFSVLYFLLILPLGIFSKRLDYFGINKFPKWMPIIDNTSNLKKIKSQG